MKSRIPQATALVECPTSKKNCEVTFEVNVFRGANHGGLEVTNCSEPSCQKSPATCGQDCIHTPEALRLHEHAVRTHQEELNAIGTNVIV